MKGVIAMRKMICILLATVLMVLCGCGKEQAPENPYRIKQQIVERYLENETLITRTEHIYDENGRLTQCHTYKDDALWYTTQYSWDEYGNRIGTEINYADGTKTKERAFTLDDQNRMIYSESFQNDQLYATTEFGYNEDGLVTKLYINRIGALNGEDLKSFVDSTYDRKGNLIREDIRWEPNNTKEYTLYTYKKGRLIRTETYSNEELDSYTEYTYDETGLIQTAIACKADGTQRSKHITTFDEYGNELEVVAYAYSFDLSRSGEINEEPDSRTTNVYELKNEPNT